MKQAKLKMPLNKAEAFAEFAFTNGIIVMLSWSTDDLFDNKLIVIVHFEGDKETIFKASEFFKYVNS